MDWHYNNEPLTDWDYISWREYLYEMLIISGVLPAVVVVPLLFVANWVSYTSHKPSAVANDPISILVVYFNQ